MTVLKAEKREIVGSKVKKLRRDSILPAVIYGTKQESINIQVPTNEFIKVYKTTGKENTIELTVDEKSYKCKVQDIDVDPVRGEPRHVDFLLEK